MEYSTSPDGHLFGLPDVYTGDYVKEFERLETIVKIEKEKGNEIVVVMGLGFVGVVMAAVVADSESNKFVIGMQRPSPRSFWKIPLLNHGFSPVKSEDPNVAKMIKSCVLEKKTLTATFTYDSLKFADILVLDVQCDFIKDDLGNLHSGYVEMDAIENSFKVIGDLINPKCLVLIETTVPPGTTEHIAYPIIKKGFKKRGIESDPLLSHSFERVMPGKEYVKSIRNFWRVCSGINKESEQKVVKFLTEVIDVKNYPLTILERPIESETCKIIENSYRATILAFLNEWSLFSEVNGIDLTKVIEAIKMRPTHSNIMFPGPGIGGYCLPKDGGLGIWAYKHLLGFEDNIFKITPEAININDTRSLHVAQLVRDALQCMGKKVSESKIAVLGASYREDVGDTRYSGSELIIRKITEMRGEVSVHDPYIDHWWEFESQDSYPAKGESRAKFFRNQEDLKNLKVSTLMRKAISGSDAVVLAVRHKDYLNLDPETIFAMAGGKPISVIDCFGILDDNKIEKFLELGCEVRGLGRGHIQRIKERVMKKSNKGD